MGCEVGACGPLGGEHREEDCRECQLAKEVRLNPELPEGVALILQEAVGASKKVFFNIFLIMSPVHSNTFFRFLARHNVGAWGSECLHPTLALFSP